MSGPTCGQHDTGGDSLHPRLLRVRGGDADQRRAVVKALTLALGDHGAVGVVETAKGEEHWRLFSKPGHECRHLRLMDSDLPTAHRLHLGQAFFGDALALLMADQDGPTSDSAFLLQLETTGLRLLGDDMPPVALESAHALVDQLIRRWSHPAPPLRGLVLAGGRSRRMGVDKALLDWEGEALALRQARLLRTHCSELFLSAAPHQDRAMLGLAILEDRHLGLGPVGALLGALELEPASAWLVLACDMPLVEASTLSELVGRRQVLRPATAFRSPRDGKAEALCAIWEPGMRSFVHQALALGIRCPRRILDMAHAHVVELSPHHALFNVNTPEDLREARRKWQVLHPRGDEHEGETALGGLAAR